MTTIIKDPEVVIDLETLDIVGSRQKFPIILSIGAVRFDPSVVNTPEEIMHIAAGLRRENEKVDEDKARDAFLSGEAFDTPIMYYSPVSLMQSLANGMTFSNETIEYWEKQSYNMVAIAAAHRETLPETLMKFATWLKSIKAKRVWANAPTFDISILRETFDHFGLDIEINFRSERDVRGAMDFTGVSWPEIPSYFVKHNALCDAIIEAVAIQRVYEQRRVWNQASFDVGRLTLIAAEQKEKIEHLETLILNNTGSIA
jgi:hypothetical protein